MVNIVKAEHQKAKRTIRRKFVWGFPVLAFAMAFVFTFGMKNAYAESVWNWWYTLMLPGMIGIFCYLSIVQEKKTKYYHLMTLSIEKSRFMLGKIIYIGCMIFLSNAIVFVGSTIGGFMFTTQISVGGAAMAVLLLTVTQLWEIPFSLFLSERFGMIMNLFTCLFITVCGVVMSQTGKWYWLVSAIPMRILCPFLHILPNGLLAESGNPFLNTEIVAPGLGLSILWFLLATAVFLRWFEKREVK